EVLEESAHWDTCPLEQPDAAHLAGHAFHSGALAPAEHAKRVPRAGAPIGRRGGTPPDPTAQQCGERTMRARLRNLWVLVSKAQPRYDSAFVGCSGGAS